VALATGLSRSALLLAITCAAAVLLAILVARHRQRAPRAVDLAAAAAVTTHTITTDAEVT
jgi:ABC-type arginine/histidine transport system permease subunit